MAKSKRKGKRANRNKKCKWTVSPVDEVRTCVSGDKLSRTCSLSLINLRAGGYLSPVTTPSPKLHVSASDGKLLEVIRTSFRPRSLSSTPKLNTPTDQMNIPKETSEIFKENNGILHENEGLDVFNSKRSNCCNTANISSVRKSPRIATSYSNIDQENNNVNEFSFFSSGLFSKYSTPNSKIKSVQQSSTPKTCSKRINLNLIEVEACDKIGLKVDKSTNTYEKSLQFSPILDESRVKLSPKNDVNISVTKLKQTSYASPSLKLFPKFRKYNPRWPTIVADIYTWIGIALRKSFALLKRYCYTVIIQQTSAKECCHCEQYLTKLTTLYTKVEEQAVEIVQLKHALESWDEKWRQVEKFQQDVLKGNIKTISTCPRAGASVPVPPPPPPPPPPLISLLPANTTLKIEKKSDRKQISSCLRPSITVDDILNVRLRKTAITTPSQKKSISMENDELFKKVRLRPAQRSQTPQMLGNSPKASLTRILKNVDTNVRTVRRIKAQFLSYDDISRQNSFRIRTTVNDSAPIM